MNLVEIDRTHYSLFSKSKKTTCTLRDQFIWIKQGDVDIKMTRLSASDIRLGAFLYDLDTAPEHALNFSHPYVIKLPYDQKEIEKKFYAEYKLVGDQIRIKLMNKKMKVGEGTLSFKKGLLSGYVAKKVSTKEEVKMHFVDGLVSDSTVSWRCLHPAPAITITHSSYAITINASAGLLTQYEYARFNFYSEFDNYVGKTYKFKQVIKDKTLIADKGRLISYEASYYYVYADKGRTTRIHQGDYYSPTHYFKDGRLVRSHTPEQPPTYYGPEAIENMAEQERRDYKKRHYNE